MAITEVGFVDDIAGSPTVLLDLNDTTRASGFMIGPEGVKIPPPALRRAVISTMLTDGETVPASAYGNRVVSVPLVLTTGTENAAASAVRNLGRILNQSKATLRVKIGTTQVFFRTLRSELALEFTRNLLRDGKVALELPAEPFAYGPEETAYTGTIASDPGAGTHPCYVDITAVKGDVLTPVLVRHSNGTLVANVAYAVRRHGTPGNVTWFTQAEALGLGGSGIVTYLNADSQFSPAAGNNGILVSPGVTTAYDTDVWAGVALFSGSASVDLAGTYRVFANVRAQGTDLLGDWFLQLRYGPWVNTGTAQYDQLQANREVRIWSSQYGFATDAPRLVDLGLLSCGISGLPYGSKLDAGLTAKPPLISLGVRRAAIQAASTSNLAIDYLLMLPADEDFAVARFNTLDALNVIPDATQGFLLDGPADIAYMTDNGSWRDESPTPLIGRVPQLSPGQTNRLFIVPGILSNTRALTWPVTVTYFPRYLVVPGAST